MQEALLPQHPVPETSRTFDDLGMTAELRLAVRELGWTRRPLEVGFRETFEAIAGQPSTSLLPPIRFNRRKVAAVALGAGIGGLVAWLWLKQRRRKS